MSSTSVGSNYKRAGQIVRLHDRDDAEQWKGVKRYMYFFAPFFIAIDVLLYLAYLGFRLYCNIDVQRRTNISAGAAWVFVGVEFLITIPYLMNNAWALFSLKSRTRPRLRLTGNSDVPTVDVFVTCCKEDNDVVMDTVKAACDQDYPIEKFRVIILDDGKSAELEQMALEAAKTWPNLFYMSREKKPGVPHHFKAGNLNYGLDQITQMPGGTAEFVGALDADMIPEPHWMRALLPHLLSDRKVAMACPPQLFYNTPRSDPLGQSLDFFVHITEPIKDTLNAAWCTGSGYICRRTALDDIGGIPVGGIAEDVATSNLFIGKGWVTAYVHEPLQFGTVPDDFSSHLKQRTRWAIGTVENAMNVNFYLWGDKIKRMTAPARISSFLIGILSFYPIIFCISLFSIPVILIMGQPLILFANDEQFRWLLRAAFATVISRRIMEFIIYIPAGYHTGQRFARYQIWMAPYLALCLIRAFILPKWLGGASTAFKPTGSLGSAINERDAEQRKGMLHRLFAIMIQCQALFHLLFVYFVLAGVCITTYKCFIVEVNLKDILTCMITHAWWPPLTWVFLASSIWTPIAYAINPPSVPDREELLNRDPKTGIAHPRNVTKKIAFGAQAAWFETEYTLTTLYTGLCFVATFFYF
ncbi:glycosyltransferase family 2 protein [Microdochium bolleyi]|uniref:Glycosyltransferase family 2 protein n=1 Tax=Microdochium bolleyi TaxID=196109 RepID=A0A136INQ6_9PEZI|nr:glycosyltransferase family 2 protein [Microdochium bolleyi]